MNILLWLIFGGFVGWIASILTHRNKQMGILANIIIGIIGSFLGGWIASLLGMGSFTIFSVSGVIVAIGGSVLLLVVFNLFRSNRR